MVEGLWYIPDGRRLEGLFARSVPITGTEYDADEFVYYKGDFGSTLYFEEEDFVEKYYYSGPGTHYFRDGTRIEGDYSHNHLEGKGVFYDKDNNWELRNYINEGRDFTVIGSGKQGEKLPSSYSCMDCLRKCCAAMARFCKSDD